MAILQFFESIRTPFLETFFLGVTMLGQQELLIGLFCVLFWMVDKRLAYRIGASAFAGIGLNQLLKNTFAVSRPFVRWPQLRPVTAALPAATGYSFPSGHTANAVAVYGIAAKQSRGWLSAGLWFVPFLVALSRVYLGVHAMADVLASLIIGIPLVFLVNVLFDAFEAGKLSTNTLLATGAVSMLLLLFAGFAAPGSLDPEQALDCFKAAGGIAGFTGGFFIENRWIHHSPKGHLSFQIQKLILGLAMTILLLTAAKSPLDGLLGDIAGSFARYGLISLWIVAGLPALAHLLKPRRVC